MCNQTRIYCVQKATQEFLRMNQSMLCRDDMRMVKKYVRIRNRNEVSAQDSHYFTLLHFPAGQLHLIKLLFKLYCP